MGREELLDNLATLLAGLQVTHSLDPAMLGSAAQPWREIHNAVGFGWMDDAQYRAYLDEVLADA